MKQPKTLDEKQISSEETILLNVGYGNFVSIPKLVAILSADSSPIKRLIQEAKENHVLVDATYGRRTRSVLVMQSGHIVLSAIQPETMSHRFHINA